MAHSAAGHDLMGFAGELPEHLPGFFLAVGLTEDFSLTYHDGVRRNNNGVFVCQNRGGLPPANSGDLLFRGAGRIHGFVNIRGLYRKFQAHFAKQLPPPGRLRR